jgi:hypothetical protein
MTEQNSGQQHHADEEKPSRKKPQSMSRLARHTKQRQGDKDINHPEHIVHSKAKYVEDWLSDLSKSRQLRPSNIMSTQPPLCLPSPSDETGWNSEKSGITATETNYRKALKLRNIHIQTEPPPAELMRRTRKIILRPRNSPEMDDDAFNELMKTRREIQDMGEDALSRDIGPSIIPCYKKLPSSNLARNLNEMWSDSVPVPLVSGLLSTPLPLSRPKPDLAIGYSEAAFNYNQLGAVGLLVHDESGTSYAVPDQSLHFPFLVVEFKSLATNGNLYVATNQVANAGAIAMNGYLELISPRFWLEHL